MDSSKSFCVKGLNNLLLKQLTSVFYRWRCMKRTEKQKVPIANSTNESKIPVPKGFDKSLTPSRKHDNNIIYKHARRASIGESKVFLEMKKNLCKKIRSPYIKQREEIAVVSSILDVKRPVTIFFNQDGEWNKENIH